jgi:predicted ATPase/DNA-binding SARP family transcriptional activator
VQYSVLGPLEVRRDGAVVTVGSPRQRALLAALLAAAGSVVPVDTLTGTLWGDEPPAEPRNAIQTYVARLRELLGAQAGLVTRSPGYALDVDADRVDARRFERLLAQARGTSDAGRARQLLDEALGLWRGEAYAEFTAPLLRAEALRLGERRLAAQQQRAQAGLALGEAADLVGELEGLVHTHPLREPFVELLMRALAATDRQSEALAAYRDYRDRLADGTGLEPSPSLSDLHTRILRGELSGRAPAGATYGAAAPPRADRTPALPVPTTSLVGREGEVTDVGTALGTHRMVTLTGTGGVGKTRVAAAAALRYGPAYGGVGWVELASVTEPATVEHVIAAALGADLRGSLPARQALVAALAPRRLLLVLDNCEHLLDAVGALMEEVQQACPLVRVLATSRERLAIDGERVLPVFPLPVDPGTGARAAGETGVPAAVLLFQQRAAAAGAGPDTAGQLPVVTDICRQLDGLPLAIELAAARTGVLSLDDLLTALREDMPSGAGSRRSRSARQRDLRAVVDWSYQLLDPPQQRLFARLGTFAGAFGSDEAHAVCAPDGQPWADTVAQLAALTERSLLTGPLAGPGDGAGRYRMLRPLRAYARQRLDDRGEAARIAARHAAVLTARAEVAAGPPLTEPGRRWLEASLDDLRGAQRWAHRKGDVGILARLVAATYRFDYWRPGAELIGWADDALDLPGIDEQPAAPAVYAAAAAAAWMRGDLRRAGELAARGATLGTGPDDPARAVAFDALGDVTFFEGRLADAEGAFREAARLAVAGGDPDGEVNGLAGVALAMAYSGRVADGIATADAAERAAVRAGPSVRAFLRFVKGECRAQTAPEQALGLLDEAIGLARDCQAWFVEGVAALTAASLRARHGDPASAMPALADLLHHWHRSGNWTQLWIILRNVAELLVRVEQDTAAVVIAAAAEVAAATPTFGTESELLSQALHTARIRLGEQAFEAAHRRARQLTGHEVVDLALATLRGLPAR